MSKYEDVNFDQLKDVSITQRSRRGDEIVYVVGKGAGDFPVYFVTFNVQKGGIVNIDKKNLEKGKGQDYLEPPVVPEIYQGILLIKEIYDR